MALVTGKMWECDVCGYRWLYVKDRNPTHCPNRECRSRRWNSKSKPEEPYPGKYETPSMPQQSKTPRSSPAVQAQIDVALGRCPHGYMSMRQCNFRGGGCPPS